MHTTHRPCSFLDASRGFWRFGAVAVLLLASGAADAAKVLVVPSRAADAVVVEAGVREGVGAVPDVEVADAAATAALMEGATSAGLDCGADDGACWLRLAVLGGLDHVVFVSGTTVTHVTAKATTSSAALGATQAHFAAACRRAFGLESAVRIAPGPAGAAFAVSFDNAAVKAPWVVEGVVPGAHVVGVTAAGYTSQLVTASVPAGTVTDVDVTLVAVVPETTSMSTQDIVFYSGVAVAAVGAVATGTFALIDADKHGCKFNFDCKNTDADNEFAVLAFIAGGVTVVGAGIVGASFLIGPEEPATSTTVGAQGLSPAAIPPATPPTVALPSSAPPMAPMAMGTYGSLTLSGASK